MNPDRAPLAQRLIELHQGLASDASGQIADYIPQLGQADPNAFGLATVTANGVSYGAGDCETEFSIQSISKPFVYAMALADLGEEAVLGRVGIEPTGDPFNAVTLDAATGRPLNPMVNAGAIVTSTLVTGANRQERTDRILHGLSQFAGRQLRIDESVRDSEFATSDRNRAIAYLMRGSGALQVEVEDALDSYIAQCSVLVTVRDLAAMCATLASGGRNPLTGQRVVSENIIDPVLSIMATCGMYDGAGEWMYRVGLPAKSGVAGGIIAALPNQLGIASWSPPLDRHGNSVRGVRAIRALSEDLDLHLFAPTGATKSPIRRATTSRVLRSRAGRSLTERAILEAQGDRIQVLELGGAVGILAAENVVDVLDEKESSEVLDSCLIIAHGIGFLHPGALKILNEGLLELAAAGKEVTVVDRPTFCDDGADDRWAVPALPDLDSALQRGEDRLIRLAAPNQPRRTLALGECEVLSDLPEATLAVLESRLCRVQIATGESVSDAGVAPGGLMWVLSGEIDVHAVLQGQRTRMVGVGPGGMSGVMAMIDGRHAPREAVAVADAEVAVLQPADYDDLAAQEPSCMVALLRSVAQTMLGQQRSTQEVLASLAFTHDDTFPQA